MIQLCLRLKMIDCSLNDAFADGDVVHAEPCRDRGDDQERHPDEAGVLQPQFRAFAGFLRFAAHDRRTRRR